jgi:hypothetical protein
MWAHLPAVVITWAIIITRTGIAAVVVRPTIIVGLPVVRSGVIPAIIGLTVVSRAEVIKQEWKRERDTETYPLGSSRELGKSQGAKREYKNQQLFHGGHRWEASLICHKSEEKEAQSPGWSIRLKAPKDLLEELDAS